MLRVATIHTLKPNPAHSNPFQPTPPRFPCAARQSLDGPTPKSSWARAASNLVVDEDGGADGGEDEDEDDEAKPNQPQVAESHAVGFRPSPCANLNLTSPHRT